MKKEVFIASDHAGFKTKQKIILSLKSRFKLYDLGPKEYVQTDDYPDYAFKLAEKISKAKSLGILICNSGIGMSIAANKVKGARAALVNNIKFAKLSRLHNDANILVLPAELPPLEIISITKAFLNTKFTNETRHKRRIKKISEYEN